MIRNWEVLFDFDNKKIVKELSKICPYFPSFITDCCILLQKEGRIKCDRKNDSL